MEAKWLDWAKQLQSIAQAGLEYSKDKYDIERFQQIRDISVEILHEYTEISHEKIKTLFCNENGYQTPKVDVRAAIFKDDKILLVKESLDSCWSLPGGWADIDLTISENAIKEAMEEAGVNVIPKRIIAILDHNKNNLPPNPYSIYKVFVLCELIDGNFENNIETEASDFYSFDNLPPLSVGRNNLKQIEMCFIANQEHLDTIFD